MTSSEVYTHTHVFTNRNRTRTHTFCPLCTHERRPPPLANSSILLVFRAPQRLRVADLSWASLRQIRIICHQEEVSHCRQISPIVGRKKERREGWKSIIPASEKMGSHAHLFPKLITSLQCKAQLCLPNPFPAHTLWPALFKIQCVAFVCLRKQIAFSYAAPWILLFLKERVEKI